MGNFTILAQKIDDQKLAVAFESVTERYMYEIVNYDGKLGITKDDSVDELKILAASLEKGRSGYSEKEIANMTKFCAPKFFRFSSNLLIRAERHQNSAFLQNIT